MWQLVEGRLDDPQVIALLAHHLRRSREESGGPDSCHALDPQALQAPGVRFWTLWEGARLLATGALVRLSDRHAEIKSMHTVEAARRCGAGTAVLRELLRAARDGGLARLSLETGATPYFAPARAFYARHGFTVCAPFGDYRSDPNSVFMTRLLDPGAAGPGV